MPLRVAVIGAGRIAENYHLPSLVRLAGQGLVEMTALCDVSTERLQGVARRFGFQICYEDYQVMLNAVEPDAVWVLVPMAVMRPIAGYTLAAGIPTLMEKPPGCNTQETRELLEIAKRYGTPHQVAVNRRYAPLLQRMKQLLGEAGPISGLSCQFYRVGRTEDHFGFGTGLHGLDAMCYLADSRVVGLETCIGPRDSAMAMLHLASGARASFEMFPQVGLQSERYTAHAGERTVIVDGCIGWLTHFPGFVECYERGHLVLREETDAHMPVEEVSGFYGESAAFVAALVTGSRPGPDLTVALRSVEMAEAVNAGADIAFSLLPEEDM